MRRIILGLAIMVLLLVGAGVATADTFGISFTAYGGVNNEVIYVNIHLTYDPLSTPVNGGFLLTGGWGTVTGINSYSILTLNPTTNNGNAYVNENSPPAPTYPNFASPAFGTTVPGFFPTGFDNILYPNQVNPIDIWGVSGLMFSTDNANIGVYIEAIPADNGFAVPGFFYTDSDFLYDSVNYPNGFNAYTAPETVPEPRLILLLGLGIGVVSLLAWRIKA
jgi:hypothetical protein